MNIKRFESYDERDVDNILECFLDIQDEGFEIKITKDIVLIAYPEGHFLYNPIIWKKAISQWHAPWSDCKKIPNNKLPSMDGTSGRLSGSIFNYYSDLIRIDIIDQSKKMISSLNFYKDAINIAKHLPTRGWISYNEMEHIKSLEYLKSVQKDSLLKKIYNLTGFSLYNCYYNDMGDGSSQISMEFMRD
jgi:hypothetical protein